MLFFDGGARGNPGPGGAGAIIVTRADTLERPHVRWMCSVFLARSSTINNVAEYKALLFGLRKASKYQLRRIHVVGVVISFLGSFEGANRRRPDTYKIFIGSAG